MATDLLDAFVAAFSNVAAFSTPEGMLLVDTSSPFLAGRVHDVLREWRANPLHTAVFTHGHIDHVFGVERYESDARDGGAPPPRVVAHLVKGVDRPAVAEQRPHARRRDRCNV